MDIRSGMDSLKSLLGVTQAAPASAQQIKNGASTESAAMGSDRATLSSAGSEVAQTAADSDVRLDKVASIQSALASGNYSVPASAVASSVVNSMLGSSQ